MDLAVALALKCSFTFVCKDLVHLATSDIALVTY